LPVFCWLVAACVRDFDVAAVIVTADLPAYESPGSKIDVTVSSIGDASTLQGAILLPTALQGPDGNVYPVAQGALLLGAFSAGNEPTGVTVNHPTVGRIANGGTVERPVTIGLPQAVETLDLELDRTDFTNVGRVAQAVNNAFGGTIASALDGRSVRLSLPPEYR
jgi:flagellar P-ring protein precursor FlgI